jgi:glycosyltransferase involved in cell wall biosynthesis
VKIGILTRKNEHKWGGDLKALYGFYESLKEIGQDVIIAQTIEELAHVDFIFLSNSSSDLKEPYAYVKKIEKPYGLIPFHSDRDKYYSSCYGFAHFVGCCLHQSDNFAFYSLDQLLEDPDIIQFFPYAHPPLFEENFPVLDNANLCIATSRMEARTIQRDCPGAHIKIVPLECGIPDSFLESADTSFLEWTGLKKGEYVLQVGRIELRKNQLGSILAMRDLEMPLVFIATQSFYPHYMQLCLDAIRKWRKAPTLVISQNHPDCQDGVLRILQMPQQRKLPMEMLISAYQNAGLYIHPAFCELPGLIYLEAAKLGVPIVASDWTTISDYFTEACDQIFYTQPHHVQAITAAIQRQFGRKIKKFPHPIFSRTKADVGRDLLSALHSVI